VLCGRHSLPLFCISVFLSFAAHWILVQYTHGVWEQLTVSFIGILMMIAIAWVLDQVKKVPVLFVDVEDDDVPVAAKPSMGYALPQTGAAGG
jgi:hypothetical protein